MMMSETLLPLLDCCYWENRVNSKKVYTHALFLFEMIPLSRSTQVAQRYFLEFKWYEKSWWRLLLSVTHGRKYSLLLHVSLPTGFDQKFLSLLKRLVSLRRSLCEGWCSCNKTSLRLRWRRSSGCHCRWHSWWRRCGSWSWRPLDGCLWLISNSSIQESSDCLVYVCSQTDILTNNISWNLRQDFFDSRRHVFQLLLTQRSWWWSISLLIPFSFQTQ